MSAIRTILFALAAGLVLCALQPAALASGYVPVHTGAIDNGSTITANGCFVRFDLSNGSGSARVTVSSPNYPQQVVTISPDQSYYYYDALRIYVASIDFGANRIMVDVSKPAGSGGGDTPSAPGTRLSCEVPGQLALAGDRVTFPIVIQNNYDEDKTYTLTSSSDTGWSIRFTSGGMASTRSSCRSSRRRR